MAEQTERTDERVDVSDLYIYIYEYIHIMCII